MRGNARRFATQVRFGPSHLALVPGLERSAVVRGHFVLLHRLSMVMASTPGAAKEVPADRQLKCRGEPPATSRDRRRPRLGETKGH